MRRRSRNSLFLALAVGCSSGTGDGSTSGPADTSADVSAPDDTASPDDTATPDDAGAPDATLADDTAEPVESPWRLERLSTGDTLRAIWGPGDGTYVAAGDRGAVLVNNGRTWAPVARLTNKALYGVGGLPAGLADHPAEAWVVGEGGTVLHRDVAGWNRLDSGVTDTLYDVAAAAPDEVYAVGAEGRVLRFDGATFVQEPSNTLSNLYAVLVPSGGAPLAAGTGGRVFKRQGGTWVQIQAAGPSVELRDLFATSGKFVVSVGTEGNILLSTGGGFLQQVSNDVDLHALSGVFGLSDTDVTAVGDDGTLIHYDGEKWTVVPAEGPLYAATTWHDVAGHTAGDAQIAWAVGDGGALLRFDGALWRDARSGPDVALRAVAPTGDGGLFAVGDAGLALAWSEARGWSATSLGTLQDLQGVARDGERLLVVGHGGTVLALGDAFRATALETPGPQDLEAVSAQGSLALAVGAGGTAWVIDGDQVFSEDTGAAVDLTGVAVRGDGGAWIVGRAGTVLERQVDGAWTPVDVPTSVDLHAVALTGDGPIIVGDHGTILERSGNAWVRAYEAPGMYLYGVIDAPGGPVAVGWAGRTVRRTADGWVEQVGATANVLEGAAAVGDAVVAVGHKGTVIRWR